MSKVTYLHFIKRFFNLLILLCSSTVIAGDYDSCFMISSEVIRPATENMGSCGLGNTPACHGTVYCKEGPYAGIVATMSCDAPSGKCPSVLDCISAENVSWFSGGHSVNGKARAMDGIKNSSTSQGQ